MIIWSEILHHPEMLGMAVEKFIVVVKKFMN